MADYAPSTAWPTLSKQAWPHESSAAELEAFYGGVPAKAADFVDVVIPWKCDVQHISLHKACAPSAERVLSAVWEYVGQDQTKIDAAHLNSCAGAYNPRRNVNAPSKWSMHAYAAAIDWAAAWNPNGKHWIDDGTMLPRWFIDAWLAEGWCWGGDFSKTADCMHVQGTFNKHPDGTP